jgi:hypothetical protein
VERHRLKAYENRVLRKILGSEKEAGNRVMEKTA